MENQAQINSSTPLLEASYVDGVVKHPFPLNYLLRQWYLGPDFYHAVKVGIVQYVRVPFLILHFDICLVWSLMVVFSPKPLNKFLLQMILKTICALLAIVFEFFGVYGEGKFEWNYGYVILVSYLTKKILRLKDTLN